MSKYKIKIKSLNTGNTWMGVKSFSSKEVAVAYVSHMNKSCTKTHRVKYYVIEAKS